MIIKNQPSIQYFIKDAQGQIRCICEACLEDKESLEILVKQLEQELEKCTDNLSFQEAIVSSSQLKSVVFQCLEKAGIKEKWVRNTEGELDFELLNCLFLPSQNAEGEICSDLITLINFPESIPSRLREVVRKEIVVDIRRI